MNLYPDLANPRKPMTQEQRDIHNLGRRMKLFTVGNPKILKGVKKGYMPIVLMLAPAYLSGWEVCPFRSPGCTRACLNTAGRGGMVKGGALAPEDVIRISNTVQQARLRRTRTLYADTSETYTDTPKVPEAWGEMMLKDIDQLIRFCNDKDMIPCVRLNGTSDLRWEKMPIMGATIFKRFPRIQFYDYTKQPLRNRKTIPRNYRLTYSFTEQGISGRRMNEYMRANMNTAVVFDTRKGDPLPPAFAGYDVIDGDVSDLRFLDPPGTIVGLRAKGFAQDDHTGFVIKTGDVRLNPNELTFDGGSLFPDIP